MELRRFQSALGLPVIAKPAPIPWSVMLVGIWLGLRTYRDNLDVTWSPLSLEAGPSVGANYRTYHHAAELARAGEPFYGTAPPGLAEWAVYLYAPITVVTFYPFSFLEWQTGYAILIALNVAAGFGAALAIGRYLSRLDYQVGWLDIGLLWSTFVLSPFSFGTIYYGNINLILAFAIIVGFLAIEEDRDLVAGVAFGMVALWKVFPALLGIWLLRVRAWRAILAASLVGVGGLLAGLVTFGTSRTRAFFLDVLLDRTDTADFVGGYPADGTYYITVQRPVSQLLWTAWPNAPEALLLPLALLPALLVLGVSFRSIATPMERMTAMLVTVAVTVVLFPALQWYLVLLFFPLLPLLYWLDRRAAGVLAVPSITMFVTTRPGEAIETIRELPLPTVLELVLIDLAVLATIQLYAIATILAICLFLVGRARQRSVKPVLDRLP